MNLIISCIINSMNWKKNFKTKLWTQIKAEKSTRLYFRLFWTTRSQTRQSFKGTKNGTRFSCTETSSISIVLYCSGLLVTIRILCSVLSERMNCNLFNNKWVLPHLPQKEGPTIINVQYKASAPIVSFVLSILYIRFVSVFCESIVLSILFVSSLIIFFDKYVVLNSRLRNSHFYSLLKQLIHLIYTSPSYVYGNLPLIQKCYTLQIFFLFKVNFIFLELIRKLQPLHAQIFLGNTFRQLLYS